MSADLVGLWRRIAFSVAINSTDDHMRNQSVLHARGGWTPSPIFDATSFGEMPMDSTSNARHARL